jgi:topoisomerase IV subunit A
MARKQRDLFEAEDAPVIATAADVTPPSPPVPPAPPSDIDPNEAPLAQYAELAYLQYAVSVVKGRALPDICDGQKPVQRRILYAMSDMGLNPTAKPVKSARVVGDVLGKYHPHGEVAAYDALVRIAQDFSLRYPLIDGHGNFGSPDGDGAAAMRYTECRLTPIASLLLSEIDQGTVDFIPNYDGAFQEPSQLPARLPFVLLNGASGIAVGLSTEIPSHNLKEVAAACVQLIQQPKSSLADILKILPGPDFPGGGQIISSATEIQQVYETGRGSLKMRARWNIEDLARGQWQIVVTELPHQVSARKVLEEIEELTNPKVKLGKKSLTQDQIQLKQLILSALDRVRDESGKTARVRLIFEPKTKNQDPQEFINLLLAHTSLEGNVSINLVAVGRDGRPRQKTLLDTLHEWIEFRLATVRRRAEYRLNQVLDRIHILEGRSLVLLNIDKVIKIIRQSDEPKPALIAAFKLSDRQAEDILEIRLRQLARLEAIKIEQEMKALQSEQTQLKRLIDKPAALRAQVVKEIEADADKYGDARRTLIEQTDKAVITVSVLDEPVTVILSQKGWIRARQGHEIDPASVTFKEGDALLAMQACRSVDAVILIGSNGRMYTIMASGLPSGRGDGTPLTSLIELPLGARIVGMIAGATTRRLLLATSNGFGFTCEPADLLSRTKAGKQFVNVDEGHSVLVPQLFDATAAQAIAAVSEKGKLLVFAIDEMKHLASGGKGVIVMGLDNDETMVAAVAVGTQPLIVSGIGRGGKEMQIRLTTNQLNEYAARRARKGKLLPSKIKPTSAHTA